MPNQFNFMNTHRRSGETLLNSVDGSDTKQQNQYLWTYTSTQAPCNVKIGKISK